MADQFGRLVAGSIDLLVRRVVVPVTSVIPRLVSSGALLVVFAALWVAVAAALVASPATLTEVVRAVAQQALPVQALGWLLFLPVMAGLWVFGTDWPLVLRLALIAGLAGWNLVVFLPRRPAPAGQASPAGGM